MKKNKIWIYFFVGLLLAGAIQIQTDAYHIVGLLESTIYIASILYITVYICKSLFKIPAKIFNVMKKHIT